MQHGGTFMVDDVEVTIVVTGNRIGFSVAGDMMECFVLSDGIYGLITPTLETEKEMLRLVGEEIRRELERLDD